METEIQVWGTEIQVWAAEIARKMDRISQRERLDREVLQKIHSYREFIY